MLFSSSSRRSFNMCQAITRACLEALEDRRLLSFSPAVGYAGAEMHASFPWSAVVSIGVVR